MKNLYFLIPLTAMVAVYSSSSFASGGHGEGHRKHHHSQETRYYPQPETRYYPQPQDPRSHQGLAGGVVGSVLGYEIGNGDPIAAGLGAAAGSYLGNGMAGRR